MTTHTPGWRPDPYGLHEFRFFSANGRPTSLVMDGGHTAYDNAPPSAPSAPVPTAPGRSGGEEELARVDHSVRAVTLGPSVVSDAAPFSHHDAVGSEAVATTGGNQGVSNEVDHQVSGAMRGFESSVVASSVDSRSSSRGRLVAYGVACVVLVCSAVGFVALRLTHGTGDRSAQPGTTTTAARRTSVSTTSTVPLPSAPKSDPDSAASALVESWASGNRSQALTVATPEAVATLFSVPYPSGDALDRGCSTEFVPIVCTFGPPGGGDPNAPIYQVYVSQTSGGWYVSSVKV